MANENEKTPEGYVPFARKLFQHKFWLERRRFSRAEAWIDLIQMARYRDGVWTCGGVDYPVKRGQVSTTMLHLAERWRWSRGKVARFLECLENERSLEHKCYTKWTLITLLKYDTYNPRRTLNSTTNGHQTDIRMTQTNKGKKVKESKKYTKAEAIKYYSDKLGNTLGGEMECVMYDFKAARKTNELAPSKIIKIVDYWLKFSPQLLLEAKAIWNEKRYAKEGKKENYFNGILRRLADEQDARKANRPGAHE